MSGVDWSILRSSGPVDIAGNFARGFDMGRKIVDQAHERSALAAYAANPGDPAALSALYPYNPQLAAGLEDRQRARQKDILAAQDRQRQTALGELYTRDPSGAREEAISSGDFELAQHFNQLDDATRKRGIDFWQQAGPIAYKLKNIADPQQRVALWQQARPMLEASGADSQLLARFDPTNDTAIDAALGISQKIGDLINQGKIIWIQQGEQPSFATDAMGRPVGTGNPYAAVGQSAGGAPPPAGTPRGIRNNNPLNLTKSSWTEGQPGYAGTDNGGRYARFDTAEAGMAAGGGLLKSYLNRGFRTPRQIIGRWAPASENGQATENYTAYVSRKLGISPDEPVSEAQLPALASAMVEFENGTRGGNHEAAPRLTSKAEYDRLPHGKPYIAPDGSRRVKP